GRARLQKSPIMTRWQSDSSPVTVSAMVPTLTTSSEIKIAVNRTTSAITHLITRAEKHGACGSYAQYMCGRGSYAQYIISCGGGGAACFSGFSETTASVVSISPEIETAFCNAVRATLSGSITPALKRSSKISLSALKPKFGLLFSFTFSATIEPS